MGVYERISDKYCVFIDTESYSDRGVKRLSQVAIVVTKVHSGGMVLEKSFNTYKVRKERGIIRRILNEYKDGIFIGNSIRGDLKNIDDVCGTNYSNEVCRVDFTHSMADGSMGNFMEDAEKTGLAYMNKRLKSSHKEILNGTKVLFGVKKKDVDELRMHNAMYDVGLMVFIIGLYVDYCTGRERYERITGLKGKG